MAYEYAGWLVQLQWLKKVPQTPTLEQHSPSGQTVCSWSGPHLPSTETVEHGGGGPGGAGGEGGKRGGEGGDSGGGGGPGGKGGGGGDGDGGSDGGGGGDGGEGGEGGRGGGDGQSELTPVAGSYVKEVTQLRLYVPTHGLSSQTASVQSSTVTPLWIMSLTHQPSADWASSVTTCVA